MKEQPILFSGPMVQAILAGRKTQTRRIVGNKKVWWTDLIQDSEIRNGKEHSLGFEDGDGVWHETVEACPYGQPGDRLYVREEYYQRGHWEPVPGVKTKTGRMKWKFVPADDVLLFEAPEHFRKGRHHKDPETVAWHKRLARFMPKAYSRITLEITSVRVEKLNDISEEDAIAEGWPRTETAWDSEAMDNYCKQYARGWFQQLWESINGAGSWKSNPWVWIIEFRRVDQ